MRRLIVIPMVVVAFAAMAQRGSDMTFVGSEMAEGVYYMAQHFRDGFVIKDSAIMNDSKVVFRPKGELDDGVYALLDPKKKRMFDFVLDRGRKFTITFDKDYSNKGMKVKGSEANRLMYEYLAKQDYAHMRVKEIKGDTSAAGQAAMDALVEEMKGYEEKYIKENGGYLFTRLVSMFGDLIVPDNKPDGVGDDMSLRDWQAWYYREHYWDKVDLTDHRLIYTPQLFEKMNYYFFGVLYRHDSDTITRHAYRLLDRVADDSTMLRYFLDFITPRYERSTKNIGWDQVFVNLVERYYLKGKCKWVSNAELYSKRQTVAFLSQSLIGAMGQELLMADTNQSEDPRNWISSHKLPQKYVILWFWDPDCNHCKKQTAELKELYDSLTTAGNKIFEVYAVGYESDTRKWINYVREHELPFINVGGQNVNIDYQEAYNVHGAPTMIILDADRRIIMNKTIATSSILPFIREYERIHPEQAERAPSEWQIEGIRKMKINSN